jgi:hypothetical protein
MKTGLSLFGSYSIIKEEIAMKRFAGALQKGAAVAAILMGLGMSPQRANAETDAVAAARADMHANWSSYDTRLDKQPLKPSTMQMRPPKFSKDSLALESKGQRRNRFYAIDDEGYGYIIELRKSGVYYSSTLLPQSMYKFQFDDERTRAQSANAGNSLWAEIYQAYMDDDREKLKRLNAMSDAVMAKSFGKSAANLVKALVRKLAGI